MMTLRRGLRAVTVALSAILVAPAGLGLLYLLRGSTSMTWGPSTSGALPLQQLAGHAAQPLGRVLLAFGAAGIAAGLVIGAGSRVRAQPAGMLTALVSLGVLVLGGAAADAVADSIALGPRVAPQLAHAGPWVSAAVIALAASSTARVLRRPHGRLIRRGDHARLPRSRR